MLQFQIWNKCHSLLLPKPIVSNTTNEGREALHNLKRDKSHMVLTANKGIALVVIDKDVYTEKCMAILSDQEVYHKWKDQIKSIHAKVLKQLLELKNFILPKFKDQCIILQAPSDNSPPIRFYGLPKIHKANIPFRRIVSVCDTSTYKLEKFLTKILQWHCTNNFSFVKDSKALSESLGEQNVAPDETLVSIDVSALFTSIPVPVALEVLKRKFTDHINQKGIENLLQHTCFIPQDKCISFMELVLKNCTFSFQWKFYQKHQGLAMVSSVSPVIANIYIGHFEEMALGPQSSYLPLVEKICSWCHKHSQKNTKYTIPTSIFRKQTHTDHCLAWNSNQPTSAKN